MCYLYDNSWTTLINVVPLTSETDYHKLVRPNIFFISFFSENTTMSIEGNLYFHMHIMKTNLTENAKALRGTRRISDSSSIYHMICRLQ